jgi:hypothetical protein
MVSMTRSTPVHAPPAPGVIPNTIMVPVSSGSRVASDPNTAPLQASSCGERQGDTLRRGGSSVARGETVREVAVRCLADGALREIASQER